MQPESAGLAAALPDYQVGQRLGAGQFGVVFAARHRGLGRSVAVKQLTGTAEARGAERFRREARLLAQLDHRHVVRVYDYREVDGLSLLIMERLTGGTFAERRAAGMGFESIIASMLAAASGLHHLHLRGVLHRDVKPANLMFDGNDILKVTDFGTARGQRMLGSTATTAGFSTAGTGGLPPATVARPFSDAFQLSFAGEFMGTPGYAAPEQAALALGLEAPPVGPAADQYALAAVLYQSVTGCYTHAIDGGAVMLLGRRATSPARPAREANPAVPQGVSVVIMRALAQHPADRFGSVEDFGLALADAAAAQWGPGWTRRSTVTVAEPGPLWDAVHRGAGEGDAVTPGADRPGAVDRNAVTREVALHQPPPIGGQRAAQQPDTAAAGPTGGATPPASVPDRFAPPARNPAPPPRRSTPAVPPRVTGGRRIAALTLAGVVVIVAITAAALVLLRPSDSASGVDDGAGSTSTDAVAPQVAPVVVEVDWRFPTGGNVFASPTVIGELVVVGSFDGVVYGIDRQSGVERWRLPTGGAVRSSAAVADGLVVVGSDDGVLRAIRPESGLEAWRAQVGYQIVSSPVVAGGRVFVGADQLYSFDAQTGAAGWTSPTGGAVSAAPAIAGDLVIVSGKDGYLYGISLADGVQLWKLDTGGAVVAAPVVVDGVAYVGSRSGTLFAVTAATGVPLWQWVSGAAINGAVALTADRVLVGTASGTVQSLQVSDGAPQWTWTTTGRIDAGLAVTGSAVVAASSTGTISLVDIATGLTAGERTLDGPVLSSPRVLDGVIFVGSYDDSVYRLRVAPA